MDPGYRSPLIDLFRRGEADRDVRLLAASGALAPRALEQLALLVLLSDDEDPAVAKEAEATIAGLPREAVAGFLVRPEVPAEIRSFFGARGIQPATAEGDEITDPFVDTLTELPHVKEEEAEEEKAGEPRLMSSLPIMDRLKLAIKGTREQRGQLIRDSNRLVAAAVLSSPKLTESEVEAFAKMANVSEEILRTIGTNRTWLKNYAVSLALTRNPKTPPGMSMQLLHRLNERDMKTLANDRNVPEAVRLAARKYVVKSLK